MANKPCVYFFPMYAAGHLISMVEFAKKLSALDDSFSIHFLLMLPNDPNRGSPLCSSYLRSLQAQNTPFEFHPLPYVEPPTCFDGIIEFESICVRSSLGHIKASLLASPSPVSGFVVDFFATDVIEVANELNIPSYIYYIGAASSLALSLFLPSSQEGENNLKDFSEVEEISVPGLLPMPSTCLPNELLNRKSASFEWLMHHGRRCSETKGLIFNSNIYIEKMAVEALTEGNLPVSGRMLPDIYPVGPIVSLGENRSEKHECLKWLDRQPMKSVAFLSFGSAGAFDVSQIRQIASALEQGGHRFLWVMRTPSKELLR